MEPFNDRIDWNYNWVKWGLCELYLKFGNLEAELEPLLELKKIDKNIKIILFYGSFMGNENLEYEIFRHKALRIILNHQVKIEKKKYFKFLT